MLKSANVSRIGYLVSQGMTNYCIGLEQIFRTSDPFGANLRLVTSRHCWHTL